MPKNKWNLDKKVKYYHLLFAFDNNCSFYYIQCFCFSFYGFQLHLLKMITNQSIIMAQLLAPSGIHSGVLGMKGNNTNHFTRVLYQDSILHFLTHRTQGSTRYAVHRSLYRNPQVSQYNFVNISQKSTGPPDLLITELAVPPGNSPVPIGRFGVKSIPDLHFFVISRFSTSRGGW